jgi:hypothetical protein
MSITKSYLQLISFKYNYNLVKYLITFCLLILFPTLVKAEEIHPRLFVNQKRIQEIRKAIKEPNSHHQQAFQASKARVDQENWRFMIIILMMEIGIMLALI